jgi:hypothetical protein
MNNKSDCYLYCPHCNKEIPIVYQQHPLHGKVKIAINYQDMKKIEE